MPVFNINSEYHSLKTAILGTAEEFTEGERINEGMKKYYGTKKAPRKEKLARECQELFEILKNNKVKVYLPRSSRQAPQQLAPRDIGFVIGDVFVISNMKRQSRKKEINSVNHILKRFKGKIIKPPRGVYLEGGNIVVDEDKVFVGIGLRTNVKAVDFLKKEFGQKMKVYPVFLENKEEILHLDAVFNLIGHNYGLIYSRGIRKMPAIFNQYELIKVTKKEKDIGACNILSISPDKLVIRNELGRVKKLLETRGFNCLSCSWDELKKTGTVGPRCAVLPLARRD